MGEMWESVWGERGDVRRSIEGGEKICGERCVGGG